MEKRPSTNWWQRRRRYVAFMPHTVPLCIVQIIRLDIMYCSHFEYQRVQQNLARGFPSHFKRILMMMMTESWIIQAWDMYTGNSSNSQLNGLKPSNSAMTIINRCDELRFWSPLIWFRYYVRTHNTRMQVKQMIRVWRQNRRAMSHWLREKNTLILLVMIKNNSNNNNPLSILTMHQIQSKLRQILGGVDKEHSGIMQRTRFPTRS